jgi:hypothetical protein
LSQQHPPLLVEQRYCHHQHHFHHALCGWGGGFAAAAAGKLSVGLLCSRSVYKCRKRYLKSTPAGSASAQVQHSGLGASTICVLRVKLQVFLV